MLNGKDKKNLEQSLNFNSHVISTAQKILERTNSANELKEETSGIEDINESLRHINDLVHIVTFMCSDGTHSTDNQSPDKLLFELRQNIPRVEIFKKFSEPCSNSSTSAITSKPYRLLLVDTPGPNEHMTTKWHKETMEVEIKKADIVLVALDYTVLGTEIDAKIAEVIERVKDTKSSKYVYAIVNKVDQRLMNGKSTDDVKRHIALKYQIDEERVFELRARHGLVGNKFLDLVNNSQTGDQTLDIQRSPIAKNVLSLCYPMRSETENDNVNNEELHKLAEQLYETSGIPNLLTTAIAKINSEIMHRCIDAAFRMCYHVYEALRTKISSIQYCLHLKLEELKTELANLNDDRQKVKEIKENNDTIAKIETVQSNLNEKLNGIFMSMNEKILTKIKDLFNEKNKKWLDTSKWRPYLYETRLLGRIASGGTIIAGIASVWASPAVAIGMLTSGTVGIVVYFHSNEQIEFDNYQDAENFNRYITQQTNEIADKLCGKVVKDVNSLCNNALQNIHQQYSEEIEKIISKPEKCFYQCPKLPPCDNLLVKFSPQYISSKSIPIEVRYRPFVFIPVTFRCERDKEKNVRFQISRQKLCDECKESINLNAQEIMKTITDEVRDKMEKIVENQLNKFEKLLCTYEQTIESKISENETVRKDSVEEQQKLRLYQNDLDKEKCELDKCQKHFKDHIQA